MTNRIARTMRRGGTALAITAALFALPALAAPMPPIVASLVVPDKTSLDAIYLLRPDLQSAFSPEGEGTAKMKSAGMPTIEDWARKYGHKEYPTALASYGSASVPPALARVAGAATPRLKPGALFDYSKVTAEAVYVIDAASRAPLMAHQELKPHPMASISKLMTAIVTLDRKPTMTKRFSVMQADEVSEPSAVRIAVTKSDTFSLLEILNVTLVTSANNTANTLARASGLSRPTFVEAMNAKAKEFGLTHTVFEDPTGIEVGNVSTAQEIAALGIEAFGRLAIQKATTTSKYDLTLARGKKTYTNTNDVLNNPYNGIYVLGGKTGYLEESKWNLVVKMRPDVPSESMKTIVVVVLGSSNKAQSFKDAETVGKWAWDNYEWKK